MTGSEQPALALAQWASATKGGHIPEAVRAVARACLIDTIGVSFAGAGSAVAQLARRVALAEVADGSCTVFGEGVRRPPAAAAYCNGTAAHALDFDDNCYAGFVHGSAAIVPAAIALAEHCGATGADLVTAVVVGAECEYAVGAAAGRELYEKGWWTTGVLGPIGAGMAAGHLMQLDQEGMLSCLGLAVAGTGGTKACFGSDAKALLAGRTSASGVTAAALAKAGASGPREPFRHPAGFARLFNEDAFDASPIGELGRVWRLLSPGIDVKNYPVCLSAHAAMDAVANLAARHGFSLHEIDQIVCDVPPVVVANLGYALPRTTREAQFSMPFAIAGILRFGSLGIDQLTPAALNDEVVQALMPRVRLTSGPAWNEARLRDAPEGANVTVRMHDGDSFAGSCANARGTAANPLRPEELEAKFLGCTEPVLGADRAGALLRRLHAVDCDHPSRAVLRF